MRNTLPVFSIAVAHLFLLFGCTSIAPATTSTPLGSDPTAVIPATATLISTFTALTDVPTVPTVTEASPQIDPTASAPPLTPSATRTPDDAVQPSPTDLPIEPPSPTSAPQALPTLKPVRPGEAVKIVAMGDSLTEGDGDERGGGYPSRLLEMVRRLRPGSTILNLGKSGWATDELVEGQLPTALHEKPDIALVWIGSNDLWYNNAPEDEEWDREDYASNIETILKELRGTGARVVIALLDDQSKRPTTRDPERGYSAQDLAQMSRRVVAYNEIIKGKAADHGAITVDFFGTTIFTDPATLAEDGNHPNARGYDIIAESWFEAVERLLMP